MASSSPNKLFRVLGIDVGIRALGVCVVSGTSLAAAGRGLVTTKEDLLPWLRSADHAHWTIEYWELINVLNEGGSVAKDATRVGDDTLLQLVRGCLLTRINSGQLPLHTCTHVVVELQHRVNHQMESLGMAIAGYLSGLRDGRQWAIPESIRMQAGIVKRKLFECTEQAGDPHYPVIKQAQNPRLQNKIRALACVDWLMKGPAAARMEARWMAAYTGASVTRDQVRTKKGVKVISKVTEEKRDDMADALLHGLAKLWSLCQPKRGPPRKKRALAAAAVVVEEEEEEDEVL